MSYNEKLKEQLVRDEGLVKFAYEDSVGKITIGVGRNLDDVGLSEEEIFYLLENDIKRVTAEVDRNFDWFDGLDEVRKNVVLNMVFNLGLNRFKGFRKTIQAIENEDWIEASNQMLDSKWARQVGIRAKRLAIMMETGEYV